MITDPDRVLHKSGVLVRIRMSYRRAEALQVVMRYLVRVSPQRREFQTGFHRFETERIYLDGIENVLTAA